MKLTAASLLVATAMASPAVELKSRQSCPPIHVFGARETTVPPGMGTAATIVNAITQQRAGATSEAIDYPACGGQANCGGVEYGDSVKAGTAAAAKAVNDFNAECPETIMVLVGYSQGGQIFDNAFCAGGDTHSGVSETSEFINEDASAMVAAAIVMGDPRYIADLPYNVGTCTTQGFAPRPAGFECPVADKVQSYCDSTDPYCCDGNDANSHQQYANKYNTEIMAFVNEMIDALLAPEEEEAE